MDRLLIKYRFQDLHYIVADGKGEFYQLPHCVNKYYKPLRKLKRVLNNGVTAGYRINRKFVSLNQLRLKAYVSTEIIEIKSFSASELPF
ncbi:MAG: hypothetical protein QNL60_10150 [Flavobacteriales bacterium]|jgi:hypothetical protein